MKKILLITTGGTIASIKTINGMEPGLDGKQLLNFVPELKQLCEVEVMTLFKLDSTNVYHKHWIALAKTIKENISKEDAIAFLNEYKLVYSADDDKQTWFNKIKEIAPKLNFASETKEYKANPENYRGHAGDLSTVLRIAITGRRNTPDLCSIMQVLGQDTCIKRIENAIRG